MKKILTPAEMKRDDAAAIAAGTPSQVLMERAAQAALELLTAHFDTGKVLFCCGGGNNGGDGLAMARFFANQGGNAAVCYLGELDANGSPDITKMSTECARQYTLLPASVKVNSVPVLDGVSAIVDAIFGIGLTRPLSGRILAAVTTVNAARIPVLALDIPSGVCADTGAVLGGAIKATKTVAIAAQKYGHILFPGAQLCGEVIKVDIGIPTDSAKGLLLEREDLALLPPRPRRAHKGTFGRVLVVGGSPEMTGAAYLCAKAAYRAGAGLVEILTPKENRTVYATLLPEAVLTCYTPDNAEKMLDAALTRASAVALGMGLGQSELAALLVAKVLLAPIPVVADADALNLMGAKPRLLALLATRQQTVLTPHLAEMSRLTKRSVQEIASNLPHAARALSLDCGGVVVLKDAHTVIADKDQLYFNTFGNSGMATAGSGDVLAGIIAAFAAAGASVTVAATCGVLAHALAGDAALAKTGSHGLMASDIVNALCDVLD